MLSSTCAVTGCKRKTDRVVCVPCEARCGQQLASLRYLAGDVPNELEKPGGTGGGSGGDPAHKLLINPEALDVMLRLEILAGNDDPNALPGGKAWVWRGFDSWQRYVRGGRHLPRIGTLTLAQRNDPWFCVGFLVANLEWLCADEQGPIFVEDVRRLHSTWSSAARVDLPKQRRIPCPAEVDEGGHCGRPVAVDTTDLAAPIVCRSCGTEWTALRLVTVALADPTLEVWLDLEAIGGFLGRTEADMKRLARKHHVTHRGMFYSVNAMRRVHMLDLAAPKRPSRPRISIPLSTISLELA